MAAACTTPLTANAIHQAIQNVCRRVNNSTMWTFRPATTLDFQKNDGNTTKSVDDTLLFGLIANRKSTGDNDAASSSSSPDLLTTFHMAFFTWTGRAICVDQLGDDCDSDTDLIKKNGDDQESLQRDDLDYLRMQLLAAIAVELSCRRVVWRHFGPALVLAEKKKGTPAAASVQPETLHGWLTLYWSLERCKAFVGDYSGTSSALRGDGTTRSSIQDIFRQAIEQSPYNKSETFRLRLATEDDVQHIDRLVHGLAVFEKEPDDVVETTAEQFRVDGFEGAKGGGGGAQPLYHCILVDSMVLENGKSNDQPPYTCAMAFCWVGYHLEHGRFLYLEDLFFEEAYRGKGGGTLVMKTLATVAQSLGCTKVVWQALDWNTPALTFYSKLGAKVQDGLVTTRFVGDKLLDFAKLPLGDETTS